MTARRIPLGILVDAAALTLFGGVGRSMVRVFELEKHLRLAGLYVYPTTYACRILLYTLVSALASAAVFLPLIAAAGQPLLHRVVYLMMLVAVPVITFALGLAYPSIATSLRRLFVESELPFFIVYLATMARGGVSVDVAMARVAELRVFKYISAEAGRVVRYVRIFGDDPVSALEKVAREHPSGRFRDAILGYVATLRAGGDVVHYLETRARETLANRVSEIKSLVDRLAIYLELYVILGVVVSLTVFTFFAVSGALTAVGSPRLRTVGVDPMVPIVYNVVVLPALGVTSLVLIHLSHPRTSLPHRLPYVMLALSSPVAVLSSLGVIMLGESWGVLEGSVTMRDVPVVLASVTAGLLVLSIPPWATYSAERRGTKGLTRSLADFLRDLSEVRKTGLSPEKCIIALSDRLYGNLTGTVRRASAALAMGISLDKALARAVGRVKDWFLAVTFRFLVDSVVVGGGSPDVIDALANFTQALSESEEELRRRLRAYVVLPYFGAFMVAVSPVVIVWQLTSASPRPPEPGAIALLTTTLSLGAVVNSYIMGLIAGKVSGLAVAAGFKHSSIMIAMTAAAIVATLALLKLV